MSRFFSLLLLFFVSSLTWSKGLVVSTYPLYLIAKEVTQNIEEPTLLLRDQTGHDISLTPMHRKIMQDASLLIWLGPEHEAPLAKTLANNRRTVSILDSGIMQTLPQRNLKGEAIKNTIDTHVWLDPNNAVRIAFFIAALRSQQQPQYKQKYWDNARHFSRELIKTSNTFQTKVKRPYWAYHDAYQYLENALNLKFAGALTAEPHVAPTLTQIKYLNDTRPQREMCLLAEGHASANQYQRLDPVVFKEIDESMQQEPDFISAWLHTAEKAQQCVLKVQK